MKTDSQIVRELIEEELKISDWVTIAYIVEQIKNNFHPTRLYNKVLSNGENRSDSATNDGIKNMHLGAEKIFRDAWQGLQGTFVKTNGRISRKVVNEVQDEQLVVVDGESKTIDEFAKEIGLTLPVVKKRLKNKWTPEQISSMPARRQKDSLNSLFLSFLSYDWTPRNELIDRYVVEITNNPKLQAEAIKKFDSICKQKTCRVNPNCSTEEKYRQAAIHWVYAHKQQLLKSKSEKFELKTTGRGADFFRKVKT